MPLLSSPDVGAWVLPLYDALGGPPQYRPLIVPAVYLAGGAVGGLVLDTGKDMVKAAVTDWVRRQRRRFRRPPPLPPRSVRGKTKDPAQLDLFRDE